MAGEMLGRLTAAPVRSGSLAEHERMLGGSRFPMQGKAFGDRAAGLAGERTHDLREGRFAQARRIEAL
jgi:hypothetical protein